MASQAWLAALETAGSAAAAAATHSPTPASSERAEGHLAACAEYLTALRDHLVRRRGHWHRPPMAAPPPPPPAPAAPARRGQAHRGAAAAAADGPSKSNPFAAFAAADDDDVYHDNGGGEGDGARAESRGPRPAAATATASATGMEMRRLLIRTLTCLSEVQSALAAGSERRRLWGRGADEYALSYGSVAEALAIADGRCAELLGGRGEGGRHGDDVDELAALAEDAGIVHVAASHLSGRVERYRAAADRRARSLRGRLEPQWASRDEVRDRMGQDRWENNPRPRGDHARLRLADERELRDLERGGELVDGLDVESALARSRGVVDRIGGAVAAGAGVGGGERGGAPGTRPYRTLPDRSFGLELELSCSLGTSPEEVAAAIRRVGVDVTAVDSSRRGGVRDPVRPGRWRLVRDGSIECSRLHPDCSKFELVSPVLSGSGRSGMGGVRSVLSALASLGSVEVNRTMGFHVHVGVQDLEIEGLVRVCQNALAFEDAIDSFMPPSRRTGSEESDRFFKSGRRAMASAANDGRIVTNVARHRALASCRTIEELADLVNPGGDRYYKLNLQNLRTGRRPTVEFRQHSSTSNFDKVQAWVHFCVRLVHNSARSRPRPLGSSKSTEEAFDILFKHIIKDDTLREFYVRRRAEVCTGNGGDGSDEGGYGTSSCCEGCRSGGDCARGGGPSTGQGQENSGDVVQSRAPRGGRRRTGNSRRRPK